MTFTTAAKRQREPLGKVHRDCPICESLHLDYEFVVEKSPVCRCEDCGLLFLNPQPTSGSAEPNAAVGEDTLSSIYRANAEERLDVLLVYTGLKAGRLLLIGADAHLSREARNRGFEVTCYTAAEFKLAGAIDSSSPFDACILFCALERMNDPLASLLLIRAALAERGSLLIIAPTTDSRTARLFRSSWWEFSRTNLFYFSVDTLQILLTKAGFGDPIIAPDRSLVSLNYLRRRLSERRALSGRFQLLRAATSMSPFLRDKAFRTLHGRTTFLVTAKSLRTKPLLSVVVPVYNERATFIELMEQLVAKSIEGIDIEIIIVESNSTDGTRDSVLQYSGHPRIRVILEDRPMGKGHAVRTGLAAAEGDIVLFQDADLEYDLNDYETLLSPILARKANFVLGSRHGSERSSWKIRKFSDSPGLSVFFNFGHVLFLTLFNTIYSQRLADPFTMYKVFRRECLHGLTFECNRFDFDFEIVIKLLRKGYKPLELPVNYTSRSIAEGKKVTVFRDPITWVRALLKFRNSPIYGSRSKTFR